MATLNAEREQIHGPTVVEMTARGKSAREIANFIGCPERWVANYRSRHDVPMPPGTSGRPRSTDVRRLDSTLRLQRDRERRRRQAELALQGNPWSEDEVDVLDTSTYLLIAPLREARRPNPHRRKTFDYEDTEEL